MRTGRLAVLVGAVTGCIFGLTPSANASFHLWQIDEVYSNADGSVQFIEMLDEFDGETAIGGHVMSSINKGFVVPNNLTDFHTTGRHLLFATPGYFALTGVPPADFKLGLKNNFFDPNDLLNWAGVNSFDFSTGAGVPLDGVNSLNRDYNGTGITTAQNSPTNFAGQSGTITIPEPASTLLALLTAPALLTRRRREAT